MDRSVPSVYWTEAKFIEKKIDFVYHSGFCSGRKFPQKFRVWIWYDHVTTKYLQKLKISLSPNTGPAVMLQLRYTDTDTEKKTNTDTDTEIFWDTDTDTDTEI